MKVLFSHSYFMRFDPKQWKQRMPYPPLGTIYAAALLRAEGHEVALFDTMFAKAATEVLPWLDREQPDVLAIYDDGFNYLTKMCLTNMRHAAFEMAALAHARGIKVIVCSSDASDHYEKYLDHAADFVIPGEGEMGLLDLVTRLQAGETDFAAVPGIKYRAEGQTVQTPKRPVMRDLDALPMPAWDLIDIRPYQEAWSIHGYFSINMATTRGCPYKCNWCAKPIYGNRYNSHSPTAKADELRYLVDRFGAQHVWFCDDIFGLKPGWVAEFADALAERNLRLPFKIQSRADLLLKDDTVADLARAGCQEVWLGAESGSQKILDAMDKGITVEQIRTARQQLGRHGIRTAFFLQFGYLGEDQADIRATFDMLRTTLPDDIGVSVAYPLPGTPFFDKVKSQMQDKTNWTDSDELALMFRNTHSPRYYKRLHRYVHKQFRKWQGYAALRALLHGKAESGAVRRIAAIAYYVPAAWLERLRLQRLLHG